MQKRKNAFTLIELLIVVAIIAILSGLTLQVINSRGQRDRAEDSIRLANISKAVEGIEAFYASEGYYPQTPGDAATYIQNWPNGEPTNADSYNFWSDGTSFGVSIATLAVTGGYKFRSDWGEVRNCSDLDPSSAGCGIDTGSSCTNNSQCTATVCSSGTFPGCNGSSCTCFPLSSYPCVSDGDCNAQILCPGQAAYCDESYNPNRCVCPGIQPEN